MLIITFHNISPDGEQICDYDYQVRVNNDVIADGRIEGHERDNGWVELVRRLVLTENERVMKEQK